MAEARILGRYPLCDANSSDTECEATGAKSRSCSVADPSRVFASKWLLLRGFPRALEGEMAWQPDKYKDSRDYTYTLSDAEIVELEDAVGAFKGAEQSTEETHQSNGAQNWVWTATSSNGTTSRCLFWGTVCMPSLKISMKGKGSSSCGG